MQHLIFAFFVQASYFRSDILAAGTSEALKPSTNRIGEFSHKTMVTGSGYREEFLRSKSVSTVQGMIDKTLNNLSNEGY